MDKIYGPLICLGVAILAGCVSVEKKEAFTHVLKAEETYEPKGLYQIQDVPFYSDKRQQCGPATLASVLTFWGVKTTPKELREELYLPKLRGTLPLDMLPAARKRGLSANSYNGDIEALQKSILSGYPLIVFLNLGSKTFPKGHYAVVTGFDNTKKGILMHSGTKRNRFIPYSRFLKNWNKTNRWTLLVLPEDA